MRIAKDISLDEVRRLAREMTFKYGFLGLERGGAKCGIRIPEHVTGDSRIAVLERFGAKIAPIIQRGIYYPGMDMNCGPDELRAIYRGAGLGLGALTDTSYFTAMTLHKVILSCAASGFYKLPRPFTVAIEGFGNVARHLASRLPSESYRIVAVSTISGGLHNVLGLNRLQLMTREGEGAAFVHHLPGKPIVPKEDILKLDVDFLVPSARIHCVNEKNVEQIKARYVVPAANAPYADGCHGKLHERGVTCLPGFVCNSGGVFASSLYDSGVPAERINRLSAELFQPVVASLLKASRRTGESTVDIAARVALGHVKDRKERGRSFAARVISRAERDLLPKRVRGKRFLSRFGKGLVDLRTELNALEHSEVAS